MTVLCTGLAPHLTVPSGVLGQRERILHPRLLRTGWWNEAQKEPSAPQRSLCLSVGIRRPANPVWGCLALCEDCSPSAKADYALAASRKGR